MVFDARSYNSIVSGKVSCVKGLILIDANTPQFPSLEKSGSIYCGLDRNVLVFWDGVMAGRISIIGGNCGELIESCWGNSLSTGVKRMNWIANPKNIKEIPTIQPVCRIGKVNFRSLWGWFDCLSMDCANVYISSICNAVRTHRLFNSAERVFSNRVNLET